MFDINKIQDVLPHRYPFLLVDRISLLDQPNYIEGYKNISISDLVFEGHFPGHPIYPGVMILEGMAQTGGFLVLENLSINLKSKKKMVYFMTIDKAKFRAPVLPGDKLVYKVNIIQQRNVVFNFRGEAYVDNKLVAETNLKAMLVDANN